MEAKNQAGHGQFLDVAISTTSGYFPENGYDQVPSNQKVSIQLEKATRVLKIVDTSGWIATVNKTQINPDASYEQNGLSGKVDIDWGPAEGAGGYAHPVGAVSI